MILYHGSNVAITRIDLEKSKPNKDFGKGFYLSDTEAQAMEMAKFKASLFDGKAIVTTFDFDSEGLKQANLKCLYFDAYTPDWIDFIISNRKGRETETYDFVYGPIADDKVGLQLRKFQQKVIDKNELLDKLKYMKGITFQYFFGTEAAIKFLTLL